VVHEVLPHTSSRHRMALTVWIGGRAGGGGGEGADCGERGAAYPASTSAAPPGAQRSAPPQAPDAHQTTHTHKGYGVARTPVLHPALNPEYPGGAEPQQGGQWGERKLAFALFVFSVLVSARPHFFSFFS